MCMTNKLIFCLIWPHHTIQVKVTIRFSSSVAFCGLLLGLFWWILKCENPKTKWCFPKSSLPLSSSSSLNGNTMCIRPLPGKISTVSCFLYFIIALIVQIAHFNWLLIFYDYSLIYAAQQSNSFSHVDGWENYLKNVKLHIYTLGQQVIWSLVINKNGANNFGPYMLLKENTII